MGCHGASAYRSRRGLGRSRSSPLVTALALLSACSGSDCGPKTELRPGDPCDRLFTYCAANMSCCHSGLTSSPVCAFTADCRQPRAGEECDDTVPSWDHLHQCANDLQCKNRRCVCSPSCDIVCWKNEQSCWYDCCGRGQRCIASSCTSPDSRPPAARDARSDTRRRDAAVERRRDAARDLGAGPGELESDG